MPKREIQAGDFFLLPFAGPRRTRVVKAIQPHPLGGGQWIVSNEAGFSSTVLLTSCHRVSPSEVHRMTKRKQRTRGVTGTPDSVIAAGKQAREDGAPRTANPYKRDRQNELWHAWDIGWCRTCEEEDEALRPTLRADANDEDPHVMSALNDGIERDAHGVTPSDGGQQK